MTNTYKRNISLDLLRIIAASSVVLTHCSAFFVINYELFSTEFVVGNILDSLSRVGVPIFLMITGALFLDENKQVSLKEITTKNIKGLALITILWAIVYSLVYNIVQPLVLHQEIDIDAMISGIINGHFHMWYLYVIIGLYLVIPFLKKIVSQNNKNLVLFFILFSFAVNFLLPQISMLCVKFFGFEYISMLLDNFRLDFFGGYITYLLVGWYIVHVGIAQKYLRWFVYIAGVASLLFVIIYVHFTKDYDRAYDNIGVPVFAYSIGVFLFFNNIKTKINERKVQRVAKLSKLTFGVYMIHVMLITAFKFVFPYSGNIFIYIFVEFVVVLCGSFVASYIVSKIPIIKNLIRA